MTIRVCFLVSEIFAWGKYGGYGSMVRRLARNLAERGLKVTAVVPRRPGQQPCEKLDGFTVLSYPGWAALSSSVYRNIDADIYHSQEASIATMGALWAMPDRKHIVTCIDPWNLRDWWREFSYDARGHIARSLLYPFLFGYYGPVMVRSAVQRAHAVFSQARFLVPKAQQLYHLSSPPEFLPNPFPVPKALMRKAKHPTVCYLARWDPRKRPEIFFELAKLFPQVRFVALGKAHDPSRDTYLRQRYQELPNLDLVGFINPFTSDRLGNILENSWIMVNTAAREGLPAAYVESAAYRCAILGAVDSDGFASRGGYHVQVGDSADQPAELGGQHATVDDYAKGLEWLLQNDHWRKQAEAGYRYVQHVHAQQKVIDEHLAIYEKLLKGH